MKIISVSYGLHGNTQLYTYLVNDNVRKGQVVFPNVQHYKSGKIYGTVGIAQKTSTYGSRVSKKDIAQYQREVEHKNPTGEILGSVVTGKGARNQGASISKTEKNEDGTYVGTEQTINNYEDNKFSNGYIANRKETARQDRLNTVKQEYQTSDEYLDNFEFDERSGR